MECVQCGTIWNDGENDCILSTKFQVAGVDDACYCDSTCKRRFEKLLSNLGTTEMSLEDLILELSEVFEAENLELSEDLLSLTAGSWTFTCPGDYGVQDCWIVSNKDHKTFLVDDVEVRGKKVHLLRKGTVIKVLE